MGWVWKQHQPSMRLLEGELLGRAGESPGWAQRLGLDCSEGDPSWDGLAPFQVVLPLIVHTPLLCEKEMAGVVTWRWEDRWSDLILPLVQCLSHPALCSRLVVSCHSCSFPPPFLLLCKHLEGNGSQQDKAAGLILFLCLMLRTWVPHSLLPRGRDCLSSPNIHSPTSSLLVCWNWCTS